MYTAKADSAIWADFCDDHPNLRQYVSRSVFMGAKPFYLRPHKWLTCKCPLCHEMFRLPGKTVKPRCWTPPVPELDCTYVHPNHFSLSARTHVRPNVRPRRTTHVCPIKEFKKKKNFSARLFERLGVRYLGTQGNEGASHSPTHKVFIV